MWRITKIDDFPGALSHSRWFLLCSNSFPFFVFLDQIHTILWMTVDDKGRQDRCLEVHHRVVGDYNFLTQKKKKNS
jgi:hypothetical protein